MSTLRAYSRKENNLNEKYLLTYGREGFTSNESEKHTFVCIDVYMMVNIVYTPNSSKWVFTLGLLAEMRFKQSCFCSFSPDTVKLNAYNTM